MPLLARLAFFPEWLQVALIVALSIVLAKLLQTLIATWIHGSARLARTDVDRVLLREIEYPLVVTVVLSGFYLSLPLVLEGRLDRLSSGVILTAVLVIWIRAGIRLGRELVELMREQEREMEFAPVLRNLWSFCLLAAGFFLLLAIWEINITPFLASAGVVGIILGIAAQDSIGNLFAGMSLHMDKTYRVGDVIQLDDGTRGTVTNMSIRSTTIVTRDQLTVTIPNSELNNTKVINESTPQRHRRVRLDVGVAYSSDLEHVEQTILEVAEEETIILDNPAPVVRFRSFDDSSVRAQIQCFIEHPALHGRARHLLIKRIMDAFRDEEITIPFPQRELSFLEAANEVQVSQEQHVTSPPPDRRVQ